jgi:glucose-1-phosphate thymidylyltransferase
VQKEPKGIAHALSLASEFVDDTVAVMLGDNIILEDLSDSFQEFEENDVEAKIFLKHVDRPSRYGIAELDGEQITGLTEKPDYPESNYAITGLYVYDKEVFDIIPELEPSDRGEYEITDVNEAFLDRESLTHELISSKWFDVGTPEGLYRASSHVREQRE